MTYNVVELIICSGFWFLVGFAISKARPKNALREALYRAKPELKPDMTFTIGGKIEVLWYRFISEDGPAILATVINEENQAPIFELLPIGRPEVGDYLVQDRSEYFLMDPESFHEDYTRVLTKEPR